MDGTEKFPANLVLCQDHMMSEEVARKIVSTPGKLYSPV